MATRTKPKSAAKPVKRAAKPVATAKPASRSAKPVKSSRPARKQAAKPGAKPSSERPALLADKCTAVAFVDAIEPVLPFWAKVGFFPTVTVPHAERAGFTILSNGKVELMYQTWSLLTHDMPALGARAVQPDKVFLFIEVNDIDQVSAALRDQEVFLPRRDTFYGATEIGYRDPQGHYVTFAQFKK
jgi:hypothetical protein